MAHHQMSRQLFHGHRTEHVLIKCPFYVLWVGREKKTCPILCTAKPMRGDDPTHTHTHTHTNGGKEREREKEKLVSMLA